MENLTPEQKQQELDNQTRLSLLHAFESLYSNLTAFLMKVNIAPQLKSHCFMNLDQGAFWAREGIRNLIVSFPPAPTPPAPPQEPKKENDSPQQESQPQDAA